MMKHRKKNRLAIFLMVMGICFIAMAILLVYHNWRENRLADEASGKVLEEIQKRIGEPQSSAGEEAGSGEDAGETFIEIGGVRYCGYLLIPKLNLELPIAMDWNFEQLRTTPCTYSGALRENDWVIAGHNYQRHFSPLKILESGDEIYFKDAEGNLTEYSVQKTEVLDAIQVEEMKSSAYDLSLFTCTYGGYSRFTVRCNRAGKDDGRHSAAEL